MVSKRAEGGKKMAVITDDSVKEVFRMMEALSVVAARTACEKLDEGQVAHLEEVVDQMDAVAERRDGLSWAKLNAEFHKAAANYGWLPKTKPIMDRVFDEWTRIRWFFWGTDLVRDPVQAQVQHRAILRAIKARDADEAQHLTEAHHRTAIGHYQRLLKESDKGNAA